MMNRQIDLSTAEFRNRSKPPEAAAQAYRGRVDSGSMKRWALALFDQSVVSGTRFLITILVGRLAGPDELGHYSLAFSAIILLGCLQEALVSTPYAVHFHRLGRRSREAYTGGSLLLHGVVAVGGVLILLVLAGLSLAGWGEPAWTRMGLVMAATVPFTLMWEFARRSLLAQLDLAAAVRLDVSTAGLQIVGLTCLAAGGHLTAGTALLAIALGSFVTASIWLYRSRAARTIRWHWLGKYWRRNWRLGKWLVAGQIVGALHSLIPVLMLTMLAGASATGIFAAYFNIALVANPLLLAMGNLLTSRSAQAFNQGGPSEVVRVVRNAALGISTALALFVAMWVFCGERIVSSLYGSEYAGHGSMLILLGLCPMAWAISVACACGLAAVRYPRGSFIASLIGTITSGIVIWLAIPTWSVTGAAAGLLVGGSVAALVHLAIFTARCRSLVSEGRPAQRETFQLEMSNGFGRGGTQECCL